MRPAAAKANELDPLLAEAHGAMGLLHSRERNWENAQTSFQRAIELNPSLTRTYTNYVTSTLIPLGRVDEATRLLEEALRADPLSLDVRRELVMVQIIYAALGDSDRALLALDRAADILPQRVGLLLMYPQMASLRGDARFAAVRRKLGLPQ
jgi:tetratricopeptide (TPR) repeat protein